MEHLKARKASLPLRVAHLAADEYIVGVISVNCQPQVPIHTNDHIPSTPESPLE
jgi:hypothetical protein